MSKLFLFISLSVLSCAENVAEDTVMGSRLQTTSQAFSTAGTWYPDQRKLVFPYYANAENPTGSVFVNGTWTESGAQDLNFLITYVTTLNLYLNEVRKPFVCKCLAALAETLDNNLESNVSLMLNVPTW